MRIVTSFILLVVSIASAYGLTCNEGFNGNIGGVPFYHWTDRNCSEKSECLMQEMSMKMYRTDIGVTARYGGCISSNYAHLLTCENLFGADSTFDPARLLSMLPDLEKKIKDFLEDLRHNTTQQFQTLFSNGNGGDEFIVGLMTFAEHLGFNMDKVKLLTQPMAKSWNWLLASRPGMNYSTYAAKRENYHDNLLSALGELDTKNTKIAEYIFSFIGNWRTNEEIKIIKESKYYPLIENLPELVKTSLPGSLKSDSWFDVMFELLGDIRIAEPKSSAFNAIKTVKSVVEIPKEYGKYVDPILNTTPDLVEHMVGGDYMYAGHWSAELLKSESKTTPATEKLSTAIFKFISGLSQEPIPADVNTLITWLPGVFYSFFPDNKDGIDRVYNELAAGFNSIDFQRPTHTLETTVMSNFLVNFTENFIQYTDDPQSEVGRQVKNLLIINFSKTFYNIMTPKYADTLDAIFDSLAEDLKDYPFYYDIGKIIEHFIINLGWKVPAELEPLLQTVRGFFVAMIASNYDQMRNEAGYIIRAYKFAYPESEFPDLVQRYIDLYHTIYVDNKKRNQEIRETFTYCQEATDWNKCYEGVQEHNRKKEKAYAIKISKLSNALSVDTSFAFFRLMDYSDDFWISFIIKLFPEYATYIRLMRVLDAYDVTQLANDYSKWLYDVTLDRNYDLFTTEYFVAAINATVFRITSKLGDVTKELRNMFAPDSCKYQPCSGDRCNLDVNLDNLQPFTRPSISTPALYPETPSPTGVIKQEPSQPNITSPTEKSSLITTQHPDRPSSSTKAPVSRLSSPPNKLEPVEDDDKSSTPPSETKLTSPPSSTKAPFSRLSSPPNKLEPVEDDDKTSTPPSETKLTSPPSSTEAPFSRLSSPPNKLKPVEDDDKSSTPPSETKLTSPPSSTEAPFSRLSSPPNKLGPVEDDDKSSTPPSETKLTSPPSKPDTNKPSSSKTLTSKIVNDAKNKVSATTVETPSTTSGSNRVAIPTLLNIALLFLGCKFLLW